MKNTVRDTLEFFLCIPYILCSHFSLLGEREVGVRWGHPNRVRVRPAQTGFICQLSLPGGLKIFHLYSRQVRVGLGLGACVLCLHKHVCFHVRLGRGAVGRCIFYHGDMVPGWHGPKMTCVNNWSWGPALLKLNSHPVLSTFSCGFNHLRPASIFGGLSTIII